MPTPDHHTMLIQLIWDFRGPNARRLARHFELQLQEFMVNEELEPRIAGSKELGIRHSIAYMVIPQHRLEEIRALLNPHRGQYYEMA